MRNVFEYYKEDDYLAHHGIKGQKWGIRRYQNADGSLTAEGKARYLKENGEFNYDERNRGGKKAAEIYGKYVTYEEQQAQKEIDKIVNMPRNTAEQRSEKALKEKEILEGWDEKNKNSADYGTKLAKGVALQHRVETKSLDYYNGKAVSPKAEAAQIKLNNAYKAYRDGKSTRDDWLKQTAKLRDELAGIVLNDIGFENTSVNRELILDYIFID